MDLGLKGKTAIITGASVGIGEQAALTFAKEGANVSIWDIDVKGGKAVADKVRSLGVKANFERVDVTDLKQVEAAAKSVADQFGKIDILVNNAGFWIIKFFMNTTPEDWKKEMDVCWYGVLNCTQAVLRYMIPQKSGSIVSLSSDAGRIGEPFMPVYSGAKAAVIAFSKAVAKDVARHNIVINAIAPSLTPTPAAVDSLQLEDKARMDKILSVYPLRRLATTQDIANSIVFLCSERANYITGQTLSVNGGYCMV